MKVKKKWTQKEKQAKLLVLRSLQNEIENILHIEILKPENDVPLLKKLFYLQKRANDLQNHINMDLIRTDKKFADRLLELMQILQVNLSEDEE